MIERKLKHLNLGLLYSLDERLFKKIAGCFWLIGILFLNTIEYYLFYDDWEKTETLYLKTFIFSRWKTFQIMAGCFRLIGILFLNTNRKYLFYDDWEKTENTKDSRWKTFQKNRRMFLTDWNIIFKHYRILFIL
jgi:hypothetical protein